LRNANSGVIPPVSGSGAGCLGNFSVRGKSPFRSCCPDRPPAAGRR
jgi:hypothetical protein